MSKKVINKVWNTFKRDLNINDTSKLNDIKIINKQNINKINKILWQKK